MRLTFASMPDIGSTVLAAIAVILALLNTPRIGAQSPDPRPQFEVAAIKENRSGAAIVSVTGLNRGDRLTATNVSLLTLISLAYKVRYFQLIGAPSWVAADRFDITAKGDADAAHSQMLPMLQRLLEDRCRLGTHRETRELPVFALIAARNGPKLQRVKEDDCAVPAPGTPPPAVVTGQAPVAACGGLMGAGHRVNGRRVSIAQIVIVLDGIPTPGDPG